MTPIEKKQLQIQACKVRMGRSEERRVGKECYS